MPKQSIRSSIKRHVLDILLLLNQNSLNIVNLQVCRELADTKSKLERATDELMSSKAAYQALEDQVWASHAVFFYC